MSGRPAWFDGSIIGAIFSFVVLPASLDTGAFTFLLNIAAMACFVVPIYLALRDKDLPGAGREVAGIS